MTSFGGKNVGCSKLKMANGLITSYFATSRQVDEVTEKQDHPEDSSLTVTPAGESGLTVDLGGLLSSGDQCQEKKKKRRRRKRGHKHLAKLSGDDSFVALDEGVKVQKEDECEEVLIMDPDEDVVWLSPLKRVASLSTQWQQLFKKKSPVKKAVSSPKRCRSPRQPAVLRQTHKSPSKQTVKRQLLATPITTKTADPCMPPVDHAPYTHLVHIQQIDSTPTLLHTSSLKIKSSHSSLPPQIKSTQSLGLCAHLPIQSTAPSFEPINDVSLCLNLLQKSHPTTNISALYSRYRSLTGTTSLAQPSDGSLPCQIAIRVDGEKINIDTAAYPKPIQLHGHMHSDLWSRVYRPRSSVEVIGNNQQCSCLCAWLRQWKMEETTPPAAAVEKKQKERTQRPQRKPVEENGWWITDKDDDFVLPQGTKKSKRKSCLSQKYLDGESDGEMEEEDDLCPMMVVCGPVGSGKTAAVYACAEELGFGVYEINSSSNRGRAQMLSTLREVTLSHLVAQRKNSLSYVQDGEKKLPQMVSLESNTLILLEEVDVLFGDEDRGFWSAVYEVVYSTKRPFVMTCSSNDVKLTCPHAQLTFSRPVMSQLALHIQLLSIAHDLFLSLESANQIVASFNSDIRKTFHFMHTWLSWRSNTQHNRSLGNTTEAPPQSLTPTSPLYLSTCWRINHRSPISTSSSSSQSDLSIAAATADNFATIDILSSTSESEHCPVSPWWRVAPTTHLLDELSVVGNNTASLQTSQSIAVDISRLSGTNPHHQQPSSAPFPLHHSLKTCTEAFSPSWRLTRVPMATEGLPFLRLISISEEQRRVACMKRRFHHYLKQSVHVSMENLKMLANSSLV